MAKGTNSGRGAWLRLALLVLIVLGGLAATRFTPVGELLTREGIVDAVDGVRSSVWTPLLFVLLYAGATALAIPGTVLTLAGGALFGVFWGTVFNSIGANIGANLAFLEARYLGRDGVQRLAGRRLAALDAATREHGFKGLLVLRLVPLVPFNALNFGSGLTAISWSAYALATVVGIFPGTLIYTNFADALLQGSQDASQAAFVRALISGLLLVALSLLPALLRRLRVGLPGAAVVALLVLPPLLHGQDPPPPDHSAFSLVLAQHVRPPSVDYAGLKADVSRLDAYLAELETTDPHALAGASDAVRLAFWINAYNACMLKQVVEHYPIEKASGLLNTVRNTVTGRPDNSVWQIDDVFTRSFCGVAGRLRSQDEIEHEIIRPMGEPRIHFAVNCAARSCPPLAAEAYVPERLDEQLDRAVRGLTTDPEQLTLEAGDPATLRLNKVLDWYGDDFGGPEGLKAFLAPYLPEGQRSVVLLSTTRIAYFDYDWTLNDIDR